MKKEKAGWGLFWSTLLLCLIVFIIRYIDILCQERILKFIGSYLDNPANAVYVEKWSEEYDHNWKDIVPMIDTESQGKQYAMNKKSKAKGYTQGIDSTFRIIWNELKLKTVYNYKKKKWQNDYFDPESNIRAGLFYLYTVKKYYAKGDVKLAIEMYCCGVNNYRSKGWRAYNHMKKWSIKKAKLELEWKKKKILGIF
jgi:hypothetical protein